MVAALSAVVFSAGFVDSAPALAGWLDAGHRISAAVFPATAERRVKRSIRYDHPGSIWSSGGILRRGAPEAEVIYQDLNSDTAPIEEMVRRLQPDLIICNGVSMYFPSAAYLLSVITESLNTVPPGGVFFLGDVRCLPLHQHFLASVELFKSENQEPSDTFDARVSKAQRQEKELLVDPEFFVAILNAGMIPNCARIEMDMKQGVHQHSLTQALSAADIVIIYQPTGINWSLQESLSSSKNQVIICDDIEQIKQHTLAVLKSNDTAVIMSNGAFGGIAQSLPVALKEQHVSPA